MPSAHHTRSLSLLWWPGLYHYPDIDFFLLCLCFGLSGLSKCLTLQLLGELPAETAVTVVAKDSSAPSMQGPKGHSREREGEATKGDGIGMGLRAQRFWMLSTFRLINLSTVSLLVGNLLTEGTGFVRHLVGLYGAAFSGMSHFYSLLLQPHHLSTWTRKGQREDLLV